MMTAANTSCRRQLGALRFTRPPLEPALDLATGGNHRDGSSIVATAALADDRVVLHRSTGGMG